MQPCVPETKGRFTSRLEKLQSDIRDLAPGREVTLVAVSKTVGPEEIRAAYQSGQRDFGENRVQALLEKQESLSDLDIRWHMIGHLQTNKVKFVADSCHLIHSIDSKKLIDAISGKAAKTNSILLQINTSGEEAKSGAVPSDAETLFLYARKKSNIKVEGLMTMAPLTSDIAVIKRCFAELSAIAARLSEKFDCGPLDLSMGMTGDYKTALSEGATILRIGSAIFAE